MRPKSKVINIAELKSTDSVSLIYKYKVSIIKINVCVSTKLKKQYFFRNQNHLLSYYRPVFVSRKDSLQFAVVTFPSPQLGENGMNQDRA